MRRKLAYSLALLSILLVVTSTYSPAAAANYKLVGVKVGNTADYSTSIGNKTYTSPDVKAHVSVFSINGALVTFNITYYFANGTADTSSTLSKSFQTNVTSPSLSTLFNWIFLIAANLTTNDPVFSGSTGKINGTTTMIAAGANRTVNHFKIAGGQLEDYWDQATGITVKLNFFLGVAWLNYTMTSTNLWSGGGGLSTTTLIIIGGTAVLVIALALLLLRRRK